MNWTIVGFGKYSDKTLPQIMFSDPDWFFWAFETSAFKSRVYLKNEAEIINRRVCAVKIPDNAKGKLSIEHVIHRPTLVMQGLML